MNAKKIGWIALALYLFSQIFFLINIQFPRGHDFDEFHYVPSAKQFLALKENQNWEHPPLGKLFMAASIAIGGDRPFGWRFFSTIFGALTVAGMFVWGYALFGEISAALFVALVSLFDNMIYVQARIGILDTFMAAFIVWGLAAFTATWRADLAPEKTRRYLMYAGICMGLGTACKWFTVIPWVTIMALIAMVKVLDSWKVSFGKPKASDWYQPGLYRGIRTKDVFVALVLIPLGLYFLTFTPLLWTQKREYSFWLIELIMMQKKMYEGQLRVVTSHPYMSQWTDWPLMLRPIWFAFDKEGPNQSLVRGVIFLGNPLVMWTGLAMLASCVYMFIAERLKDAFLILVFYGALYFSWALIPRKISFYYYYYPAGLVLSLALGFTFVHGEKGKWFEKYKWARWAFLGCVFAMFVYFFPILAALKIDAESYRKWMWFTRWI